MKTLRVTVACLLVLATASAGARQRRPQQPAPQPAVAERLTVEIANPTNEYREQLVELPADSVRARLGGGPVRVLDAAGLEVPCQLTHDGRLLIDVAVRRLGTARFTIVRGTPRPAPIVAYGAFHPERLDDFAWENDRGSYRVYGPALQRRGERSFGIDVWTKNGPELVNDDRYYREDVMNPPRLNALRRKGLRQQADSLYRTESYHYDHGRGLDPYKVGATLGCGAPALMLGDSIVMPYSFAEYDILDNGPLRFSVHLMQSPAVVGGDTITEHRVITLDKGSNFNRMTVWYEGLHTPVSLCAGVVVQREDPEPVVLAQRYVSYTDPTDKPNVAQAPLYVATLFPQGAPVQTRLLPATSAKAGYAGHALCVLPGYDGSPCTYYFGSAWARYDVRTPREWQARIEWFLDSLDTPLQVTMK